MKKTLLFVVLFLPVLLFAKGYVICNSYDIGNLTNDDGLSNSSINAISQDSDGLMWFGTWDGLNVYNGRELKVFKPEPANPQSISNNIIRDIIEEWKGIHWIATDWGINRFDSRKNTFQRFFAEVSGQSVSNEHSFLIAKNSSNRIFGAVYEQGIFYFDNETHQFIGLHTEKHLRIKKIFFDSDDNLWYFTEEKSLFKIHLKKKKKNTETPKMENIVQFQHLKNIETVFFHAGNEIFLQTKDEKMFSYHISKGVLNVYPAANKTGIVRALVSMDGYQLLGTETGLFRFDLKTNKIEIVLPNVSVLSLYAGSQQIIWVGTDMQGIRQLSPSLEKFKLYSSENVASFGRSAVRTFFEDRSRLLWIGTKGSGIYVFNQRDRKEMLSVKKQFGERDGLLSNSVFTIVQGQGNEYWIGTDGRGINYFDTQSNRILTLLEQDNINLSSVYSILPDGKDTLWVGTSGFGIYRLEIDRTTKPYSISSFKQYVFINDRGSSLSNNIVYSIIKDDDTYLWIATRGGGLNRFNKTTEKFETFRFSSEKSGFISSDDVLCLHKDSRGFLWAGTSMGLNKLIRFDNGETAFISFTEKEGMPNNTIHGILEDTENNLWLSTNRGIAKLIQNGDGYRIISYFRKDGLQNNEFSDGAFYVSPYSGLFYFGGISGFNEFNPLEITHSSYMPPLLLDAFYVDNIKTNLPDLLVQRKGKEILTLSYKNKSFSFRFVPLDYLSGSKSEIAYLLEGYQEDWIHLGTSNTIVLTNLPKGDYVLKVKCSNADKIWSDEYFSLAVKMLPPWWAGNIAYVCYFVLLMLLLFGINRFVRYQISVRNDIKMKELDKQKTEEIHQAKLRFFTNIAHEFSNSLTLIYGPCEQLLRTHSADSFTRKYINIIKSNSERMQTLIQQLIEFRKAETGHLKLTIEKVDISELVRFVIDNFLDMLEQKKIQLKLQFSPENISWQTDRDSVEKIIFNLISNAVKYTPQEENIEVSAKTDNSQLLIRVTNTGVGIKEAYRQNIFDRFEVLDRFERQVSKGLTRSGIGLALCKNITEVLQGNIEVDSDGETYTSFVVTLPEHELSETVRTRNDEVGNFSNLPINIDDECFSQENNNILIPDSRQPEGGLVLVIDDEKEIRQLLNDFLNEKYEVAQASNGQEAIEIMKLRIPLIIICDIIMPVMNGVEFVKTMKGQELTRHIPIILLSSKSSVQSQIEGLEVGADAYLSKPFHPRHLEAMIESLLHRNKAILDYNESHYAALEQFEGKTIRKEDKELILHITGLIYDNIDNEALSIEFIAGETAISKMQLYRKIKELTEQTPTEYIRSIRLKQAQKYLKTTNKTVQEIMYMCGFNNKAYFYREFAKKYNLTPKEYRNKV